MSRLYVVRRAPRKALYLPMTGTRDKPSLMFFLPKNRQKELERSELDELVRAQLEKQGITNESEIQALITKAEEDYEKRVKTAEASKEVKRLMALKGEGAKLMSVGPKKWKQAFYRPIK